eukprot:XP_006595383.1 uncharacterized protein LOC102659919 [Glycine max]
MAIRGNLAFAMLVLAGIVVLGNMPLASAQCGGNFTLIFQKCGEFIRKEGDTIPPSQSNLMNIFVIFGIEMINTIKLCFSDYVVPPAPAPEE